MPTHSRIRTLLQAREMFAHGYASYMRHAFPHDELRPLSRTWTDSLVELGNAHKRADSDYPGNNGVNGMGDACGWRAQLDSPSIHLV